ncbi:MAG: TetR/AcrR family transcriptional regulator [Myxococcota bacterium]
MSAPDATAEKTNARDRQKAATWERILGAARSVFFEWGFADASLDEVAKRAGVAKGTLYRHVESKTHLFVEVLIRDSEVFIEEMARVVSQTLPPTEKVLAIARFYVDFFHENPDRAQILWAVDNQDWIGEIQPDVVQRVTQLFESQLRVFSDVIQQGIESGEFADCDPWVVAYAIWGLGDCYLNQARSRPRQVLFGKPIQVLYDDGLRLILSGLLRREPA